MTSANVEAVELLPCPNPWCHAHTKNSAPKEAYAPYAKDYTGSYSRIVCAVCPIVGPAGVDGAAAAAAWNTRPSPAPSEPSEVETICGAQMPDRLWLVDMGDGDVSWSADAEPDGETPLEQVAYVRAALALPDREAYRRGLADAAKVAQQRVDLCTDLAGQARFAVFEALPDAIIALVNGDAA